jgi:hypothetical protein
LRAASPFESDWGFRRCGLVFAAPGPPTAVHLPSPPPLPPSPHALPMRFPGRALGEGLAKPRPDQAVGTPGADPGERRGFVRANPMGLPRPPSGGGSPGKTRHGLGEIPRESSGRRGGRPRGKAPEGTWGEEGNGGRKPGERGARSDGSRRQWPTPMASIRRLQTRKGFPQGFPASGRNPSAPNFLATKNRSDFLATRNSAGKPGENPATARKPDAPERPEAPGKSLRATCGKGHGGMGGVA